MHVAREKIKTNIGEYFIYMFQVEDLIRACEFNHQLIDEKIVAKYQLEPSAKNEAKQWYFGLAALMQEEEIEHIGHLGFILNKIDEVNEFHQYCINQLDDNEYNSIFNHVTAVLEELASKQGSGIISNPLLTSLNAVYGLVLLKMKNQQVSIATQDAIKVLGRWVNLLSRKFRDYESGDLQLKI
jgi:hypothetical protein